MDLAVDARFPLERFQDARRPRGGLQKLISLDVTIRADYLFALAGVAVGQLFDDDETLNLPARRSWQRFRAELVTQNPLVFRQRGRILLNAFADDLLGIDDPLTLQIIEIRNDDGMQALGLRIGALAGNAHHAHLFDVRHLQIMSLDLFWVNLLARVQNDHLFPAASNVDIAVFILRGEIAGIKPSVAHDFRGRLRVVQITLHQRRTRERNLAYSRFIFVNNL